MHTTAPALAATVFVAVLTAEVAGDKTLYSMGALASRHRVTGLLLGGCIAVLAKMGAAVLAGSLIARVPPTITSVLTATTFVGLAFALYRDRREVLREGQERSVRDGVIAGLLALVLTEWGDPGQIAAALCAATWHRPALVWLAASAAMFAKLAASVTVGAGLRRWLPPRIMRSIGALVCVAMAVLAATGWEV